MRRGQGFKKSTRAGDEDPFARFQRQMNEHYERMHAEEMARRDYYREQ